MAGAVRGATKDRPPSPPRSAAAAPGRAPGSQTPGSALPALGEAAQPAHTMGLSRAKQRRRNSQRFLSSEQRQHKLSAFQALADALTSARSPGELGRCLNLPLSWDLQAPRRIFSLCCHDRPDRESRRERE